MPHSTVAFPFEFKILAWAGELSYRLTGHNRAFLILLRPDGAARGMVFSETKFLERRVMEKLIADNPSWLFYDPFDAPEYTWIEWENVKRETFERLLNAKFAPEEFDSRERQAPLSEFPISWGVMF